MGVDQRRVLALQGIRQKARQFVVVTKIGAQEDDTDAVAIRPVEDLAKAILLVIAAPPLGEDDQTVWFVGRKIVGKEKCRQKTTGLGFSRRHSGPAAGSCRLHDIDSIEGALQA